MTRKLSTIRDLQTDKANANKGTDRGRQMVEASLRETGAGRSILADSDGRIIAGNKTLQAAAVMGMEIQVVETDGKRLVVLQRTDLDLDGDDGTARKMAYYDNRASEVGLAWDAEQLAADIAGGLDLGALFGEHEIDRIIGTVLEDIDPELLWQGMPEYNQEDKTAFQSIHLHFKTKEDVVEFAKLIEQTITESTRSIWYPQIEIERYADKRYAPEP